MLSERDKSVVDAYARTGMSLEILTASFPKFDKTEIEEIYNEFHRSNKYVDLHGDDNIISCNCS